MEKFRNAIFYASIGIAAGLALALLFYWGLRLDSSIASFLANTASEPVYAWLYAILTLGIVVLFGVNAATLVYRWRKFGFSLSRDFKSTLGGGFGSFVGLAASGCPACGSIVLSSIGIAGGLTAFPFAGLELKAVSFALMAWPFLSARKEMKSTECADGVCSAPRDPSLKESDKSWLHASLALVVVLGLLGWQMLKTDPFFGSAVIINPGDNRVFNANIAPTDNALFNEVSVQVFPASGYASKVSLRESVLALVKSGVIDAPKFTDLYAGRGGFPGKLQDVLERPHNENIVLTQENANFYINLLWPLGLANTMIVNEKSPVKGEHLFNFASTGGWTLGNEDNGGKYFNKFAIVPLTKDQEALVKRVAENTYRPCCGNSTFFQDCNHGSALLGLLELGASQGLTEAELYREALAFNSYWFPHNYIQTALYFKAVQGVDWGKVDPKIVMGKDYSSSYGWYQTVSKEVERLGLVPKKTDGAGCGV